MNGEAESQTRKAGSDDGDADWLDFLERAVARQDCLDA